MSRPAPPSAARRLSFGGVLQAKLTVNAPGDRYEQEADRVADQVLRIPEPGAGGGEPPPIQRMCSGCAEEEGMQRKYTAFAEEEAVQAKGAAGGPASTVSPRTEARISGLRGGGQPLPRPVRSYFEPRFGRDLAAVRVHTGAEAASAAREVRARAFTVGKEIAFGAGQWRPESPDGRRLLAHELAHTIQQDGAEGGAVGAPRVEGRLPAETLAGDWIIDNPGRRVTSGGKTDAEHVEDAFGEICNLAGRSGNRIQVGQGPPNPGQVHGCACLSDIEADLASPSPRLSGTPHVELGLHGWSFTRIGGPLVSARHPDTDFGWGYWTGGGTRHRKPFWRTMAHEVCGHMATFARTGSAGGRASATGHNPAIEEENRIAGEHGVPVAEQRGLDVDPSTGRPLPGHRGESFLAHSVMGFAHASDSVPSTASGTIAEAADTIATMAPQGMELMIQVEGKAFANEGGLAMARRRAQALRGAIRAELVRRSIPVTVGGTRRSRFTADLAAVVPGASAPQTSNAGRRVEVFLFHKLHSAGP